MSQIRISVVMPAHNAEDYISSAIDSILNQTYSGFELIIVDDSSTDATWSVVESYIEKDPRIKAYQAQVRNAGLARNIGVAHSQADYIAFMDSDDIAYPDRLEKQLTYMQDHPEVVVLGTYLQKITPDGKKMDVMCGGSTTVEEFLALDRTQKLIRIYGTAAMVRKDIFEKVGGFLQGDHIQEIHGTEDGELWDRMAAHGYCLTLPEVLIDYRQHTESISVKHITNRYKAHLFIKTRHAMRLQGKTLTLEEFLKGYHNYSSFKHFGILMRAKSEACVRNAKIYKAQKHYVAMMSNFARAFLYHPVRFLVRLF